MAASHDLISWFTTNSSRKKFAAAKNPLLSKGSQQVQRFAC
jgi:hypothetical protein